MKAPKITSQQPWKSDDLNEWVLEAAANDSTDVVSPETTPGNANITVWDETSDIAGLRVPSVPSDDEETIAEQLVDAGNNEASQEQRLSAARDNAAAAKR